MDISIKNTFGADISIYLTELDEKVKIDSSQIKQLISDLLRFFPNSNSSLITGELLFSKITEYNLRVKFCRLLEILIKRIVVSSRRSKNAFTSLWDELKRCLKIILEDALKLKDREHFLNLVLRRILQLEIEPSCFRNIIITDGQSESENWLALDLNVQLNQYEIAKRYTQKIKREITDVLDLKSLYLYFSKFNAINEFLDIYVNLIINPSEELHKLFFKKYFSPEAASIFIKKDNEYKDNQLLPIEFIAGLKQIECSEWLKFSVETLNVLIGKLKKKLDCKFLDEVSLKTKEICIIFELLTEITVSLEFRTENFETIKNLFFDIANNFDILTLPDLALSKYWYFISELLSEYLDGLCIESKFIYTLELPKGSFLKSKASVCRVITLYWPKLKPKEKNHVLGLLLNSIVLSDNNKLRWNVAIALMNFTVSKNEFNQVKEIWIDELQKKEGNLKVILSITKLLLKWSRDTDYQIISDSNDLEIIWMVSSKLKIFIKENLNNLEFEEEEEADRNDVNEKLVETGQKLEELLNKLMVDSDWFRRSK